MGLEFRLRLRLELRWVRVYVVYKISLLLCKLPEVSIHYFVSFLVPSSSPLIKNITSFTSRSLMLIWTAIDNGSWHGVPRGYCVTYQARGSSQSDIQEIQDPSQLSANITSLKPYTRYYVQVAAKTGAGCGAQDRTSHVTMEDGKNAIFETDLVIYKIVIYRHLNLLTFFQLQVDHLRMSRLKVLEPNLLGFLLNGMK